MRTVKGRQRTTLGSFPQHCPEKSIIKTQPQHSKKTRKSMKEIYRNLPNSMSKNIIKDINNISKSSVFLRLYDEDIP